MTDRKELEDAIKSEVARGQFSLMNDELFRYVFGREESRDITAEFLSAELEKDFGHRISGISFRPWSSPSAATSIRSRALRQGASSAGRSTSLSSCSS